MIGLPGGAVRINAPDQGIDANQLEALRVRHVIEDMAKGSPELRAQHVEVLRQQKVLAAGLPGITAYWASIVGEKNARDAMAILHREADQEIARAASEAALAAARRKG